MPGYISEVAYKGGNSVDFIEVAVTTGTDLSGYSIVIYDKLGLVESTFDLGSVVSTVAGKDAYLVNDSTPGFIGLSSKESIALVDDLGNVVQFISFESEGVMANEGPANGLTPTDVGTLNFNTESLETSDGGSSYAVQSTPNPGSVPCYAPGTMIDTPDGPCAVEALQVGDLVMTLDHGPQAIRWVHSGHQPLEAVDVDAKPVLIAAGALGHKLPGQDLIVSPQHRMLVGGHRQLQGQFKNEALVPAKSLTKLRGIRHMRGKPKITWIHFACDRHEIVFANGCLSESLLLGPMVVNGLTAAAQQEVNDIFGPAPTPGAALNGPPALECLKVGAAQWQLEKGFKLKRPQISKEIKKWDVDVEI
jgi:hypothetical protein